MLLFNITTDDLEDEELASGYRTPSSEDAGDVTLSSEEDREDPTPPARAISTPGPSGLLRPADESPDESPVRGRPRPGRPYLPVGSNLARRARAASRRIAYSSEEEVDPPTETSKKNCLLYTSPSPRD